ncbi:uncharacterized protein LOC125476849 [Pyrus x bretschneideri]|uniref:uncharacterized protein LOC125476849 n=1 Tax=Pyrus x bretschneideri TaxID=225117 RepID=UPI00203099E4|nr:uncharacterized protein LOC125476849 [Pyrus x bretschneideri]
MAFKFYCVAFLSSFPVAIDDGDTWSVNTNKNDYLSSAKTVMKLNCERVFMHLKLQSSSPVEEETAAFPPLIQKCLAESSKTWTWISTKQPKVRPFSKNAAFYHSQSSSPSVIIKTVRAFGGGRKTRKACRSNIGGCARKWQVYLLRICHALHSPLGSRLPDTVKNGKAGTKGQCIESAMNALKDGKSVFIDRCNVEKEQGDEFVKLGDSSQVDVHAVVLDLPAKLCILRYVKRTGHEGNVQGRKAVAIVNRMLRNKELPKLSEGFAIARVRVMFNLWLMHIVDLVRWIHFPIRRTPVQKFN